jgi:hypothetical protein
MKNKTNLPILVFCFVMSLALGIVLTGCQPRVVEKIVTQEVKVEVTKEVPVEVIKTVEVPVEVIKTVEAPLPDPNKEALAVLETSLHGTTSGKAYFYSKDQGGMELLTGIPYEELKCRECHTRYNMGDKKEQIRCEGCHITAPEAAAPPMAALKLPQYADTGASGCLSCHRRQGFEIVAQKPKVDPTTNQPVTDSLGNPVMVPLTTDVHRSPAPAGKAMQCVNCHSQTEIHGDGNEYHSLIESPSVKCVDCHKIENLSDNPAHTQHGENVSCAACHVQTVTSCYGCHFNVVVPDENGKAGSEFPYKRFTGWKFLVKRDGKYDLANLMAVTYSEGDETKTFAVIAPNFGHTVSNLKGDMNKACAQCHDNANVKAYNETGKIVLTRYNPETKALEFPAAAGVVVPVPQDYQQAFQLAFMKIVNLADVLAAEPAKQEATAIWEYAKDGVDLWQMLFAEPLDKMPPQMQFNFPTPTPMP